MFDYIDKPTEQDNENNNKIEIVTDFMGNYYVAKIYENETPKQSNYELFKTEYENVEWTQEVIVNLPENLEPDKRYSLKFRIVEDWDFEHVECDCYIHYVTNSLKELK